MSVSTDILLDRRRLKRRIVIWRTFAIISILLLVLAIVGSGGRFENLPLTSHVARLNVVGVIVSDTRVHKALADVADDPLAQALIVRIDSPGGTFVGGEALFLALRRVAEEKPVVAVMDTLATSAGYMVAIAADRIVAHEGSVTGSIGVIMQTADITALLEKLGVTTEAIKSGPLKAVPSPLEPLTDDGRRVTQDVIAEMHDMFVDLVAERRGLEKPTALRLADGRIYTGRGAMGKGLIDEIGGEPEARSWLQDEHGIPLDLPMRDVEVGSPAEKLLPKAFAWITRAVLPDRHTLDGLISLWQPGHMNN